MNNPLVQLDPGLFIWTILTFLLLLFVLAKFAWQPLLKMLKDREELIRSSLEDAEKAQTELAKLNAEGEKIINKARAEAQEILTQGKAAAAKMKEETLNDAKEKAKSIAVEAEKQIQIEKEKAIAEIKGEVVNLSLSVAEKLIKKNLSAEDNKALIDESLSHVKEYEA
ncbi:MAG TPA: F0F1 ATP synthase subunit B [Candidatus Marinimicrobia bacterium]|jgi:F-type H+-transporting ATPase subunit b|nr:ATP synthase F0 subunit B [Candidatus Neomarinimicrobiota bacterium]MDP6275547.1 F0F1 ATP synthase subunit B [Candidatus Neomarinimicrobiota bacterium]MDP7217171.1 F0F1 ATP synthase subunit B [Candidatus Neomarinimicrobiota bacterium]MDP7437390.1 F0F1 ATP synthase subunit B [Candidatus Neomarinimicrobiota bacterium]HJL74549.1 F0F1 ATP synthase subunit B [Candidatus Neomarinimicrobiota bacterium]|tara:strand:- start:6494 stop:6997 length:504 start_codon:yes stop_codon:yes gene_type:complete